MNLFHKSFQYLDKEQRKSTAADIALLVWMSSVLMMFLPLMLKLLQESGSTMSNSRHFIPSAFGLGTLSILITGKAMHYAKKYKSEDRYKEFRYALISAVLMGSLFLLVQYRGWHQVMHQSNAKELEVLTVIILFHSIQCILALIFLIVQLIPLFRIDSPASHYIYFLNVHKNRSFYLTMRYWDFLTVLWLVVYGLSLLRHI